MINFFYEDVDFRLDNETTHAQWLLDCAQKESREIEEINYIFCSDDYLHKINLEYLDHDTYTDIITFDNSQSDGDIESDIYISIDRVRENADTFNNPFSRELQRVMSHGLLHLLGYKDKAEEDEKIMREKEDYCLSLIA